MKNKMVKRVLSMGLMAAMKLPVETLGDAATIGLSPNRAR